MLLLHARHQLANVAALGRLGRLALQKKRTPGPSGARSGDLRAVPDSLIRDYIRWSGGDPKLWRGQVPPHLFPQWSFPLLARSLEQVPYRIERVLNQGCRLTVHSPLPRGERLMANADVVSVQEDERKARIHQRIVTGPKDLPEAVVADVYAVVPLPAKGGDRPSKRREKARVPLGWRPLTSRRLGSRAGWEFALLTGDFNPVHWLRPYAGAAGFPSTILHGFAQMAFASEALVRHRFGGDISKLHTLDVRFVRPLLLPARPAVFIGHDAHGAGEHGIAVGTAPGGPAFMIGSYSTR